MIRPLVVALAAALLPAGSPPATLIAANEAPSYTSTGELKLPANYREWIFLTSGLDMNYNDPSPVAGHSTFQNVFVNPSSYRAFLATGTWPDKTTFVLELRGADAHANIDKRGQSQTTDLHTVEIHVKDAAHIPGGWGFYNFGKADTGKLLPHSASCYACHEAHAAVDTTFVQFYPTLIDLAKEKKTLSAAYLKDLETMPVGSGSGAAAATAPPAGSATKP